MKNASKSRESENKNIEPAKKAYVKPVVDKHTAATQIVGSDNCSFYQPSSSYSCGCYYI
jgi:hypothetical protein